MKTWLTAAEIAELRLPDMPATRQGIERMVRTEGWRSRTGKARKRSGRGGGYEYHVSLLPGAAQMAMAAREKAGERETPPESAELWERYDRLPATRKQVCEARLNAIQTLLDMVSGGMNETRATAMAARQHGVSPSTLWGWKRQVQQHRRSDWLAALAPEWKGSTARTDCHETAWDVLVSDYLRPERPSFSSCYRRMADAAKRHQWAPIPPERTLRRRLEVEVPRAVILLTREGRDAAKTLYPAQRRTRTHLHAMEAVNMDGHKFDVFVNWPGSDKPVRPILVALQDLYSGKFIAWRLSDSENKETVRAVIGDMVEKYGIPRAIFLDNGRAFASKDITGGAPTRFRFKVQENEQRGLLTTLGVQIHWTTPYSGQSKPIERAFRDLADAIAKHPAVAGAYTGNKPDAKPENYASRAINRDVFEAHVAQQIAEHNARPGHQDGNRKGRNFDETFSESLANGAIVRVASEAQRALWLLSAERVRAKKGSGEVHILGNRYWAPALNQWAGKDVVARYDPQRLGDGIKVYDLTDRLICDARIEGDQRFDDAASARQHGRNRRKLMKGTKELAELHRKIGPQQLGEYYEDPKIAEATQQPERPRVVAIGNVARVVRDEEQEVRDSKADEEAFYSGLGKFVEMHRRMKIAGGSDYGD
ncbi:MAG: transposase domain-containing protein [Nitratireductor sp.]